MKSIKELTIKNNFLFNATMIQGDNCKKLLEMVLGISIRDMKVHAERSFYSNPTQKGVRFDVYAEDEAGTRYDVEIQLQKHSALPKRVRYYHSQVDMDVLYSGGQYKELPKVYVIFICDFDPFGKGRYMYTFENRCVEDLSLRTEDESYSIFLSTKGKNPEEVPGELVKFLEYVGAGLTDSTEAYEDEYIHELQETVERVKADREWGARYMTLEEYLEQEMEEELKIARVQAEAEGMAKGMAKGMSEGVAKGMSEGITKGIAEGKKEDILVLLEDFGPIPTKVSVQIQGEKDLDVLKRWIKLAAKSDSMEDFMSKM